MAQRAKFVSVDQLPEDPLRMPPPYWRSGGAAFQLDDALENLLELLEELLPIHEAVNKAIDAHFDKYPNEEDLEKDDVVDEFGDICDPLWEVENRIKLKCELARLMAAIQAEEAINRFCVFNLPKELVLVETLEKMSPCEKLTATLSHLGKKKIRSTAGYCQSREARSASDTKRQSARPW